LDSSRSDNPRDKALRATQNLRIDERQDVADQILARLESPEMLMIERRGCNDDYCFFAGATINL
jgi:hypothetical protein